MINFDCGNRTKDCENATICPCLNFINEQKKSYKELINSDIFKIAIEEEIKEFAKRNNIDF